MKDERRHLISKIIGSSKGSIVTPTIDLNTQKDQLVDIISKEKLNNFSNQDEKVNDKMMIEKGNLTKKTRNLKMMSVDNRFDISRINTLEELTNLARINSSESEELYSPITRSSIEVETYFDARSSQSISLPATPSSSTSSTTPSESIGSPSNHHSDYFSRPFRNVDSRSTTLTSIPSSPLPVPSTSSPYSTVMIPLVNSPISSQSSSPDTHFFMESLAADNSCTTQTYSNDAIDLSARETVATVASLSSSTNHNLSERRYHALTELIETETSYLGILKLLVEVSF